MNCDLAQHLQLLSSLNKRSCGVFKRIGGFKRNCSVKMRNLKSGFLISAETDIWDMTKI